MSCHVMVFLHFSSILRYGYFFFKSSSVFSSFLKVHWSKVRSRKYFSLCLLFGNACYLWPNVLRWLCTQQLSHLNCTLPEIILELILASVGHGREFTQWSSLNAKTYFWKAIRLDYFQSSKLCHSRQDEKATELNNFLHTELDKQFESIWKTVLSGCLL